MGIALVAFDGDWKFDIKIGKSRLLLQMLTTPHAPDVPEPCDNDGLRNDLDIVNLIGEFGKFLRTGQYNRDSYEKCLEFTTVITVPDLLEAYMENFTSQLHPYRIMTFDFEGPAKSPEVLVLQCLGTGSVIIHLAQIKEQLRSDPSYNEDKIVSYFQKTLRPLVQAVCSGDVIVLGSDISEDVKKLKRFFAKTQYFEDIEGGKDLLVETKWLFAASKKIGTFHSDVVNFLNHRSVKEGLGPIALCTNQYNHKTFSKDEMLLYLGLNPGLKANHNKARKQWNTLSRDLKHGAPEMAPIFSWGMETLTDKQKLYAHLDVVTPLRLLLQFAQRAAHLDKLSVHFNDFAQFIDEALRFAAKITPCKVAYKGLGEKIEKPAQEEEEMETETEETKTEEGQEEMETDSKGKDADKEERETQKHGEEATTEREEKLEEKEKEIQTNKEFLIDISVDPNLVDEMAKEMSKDDNKQKDQSSPKPSTSKSSELSTSTPSRSKDSFKIPRKNPEQATNERLIALAAGKQSERQCAPLGKKGEEWDRKQKEIRDRERSNTRRKSSSRSESRESKESRSRDRSRDRHRSQRREKSKERNDDRNAYVSRDRDNSRQNSSSRRHQNDSGSKNRHARDHAKERPENQDSEKELRIRQKLEEVSRRSAAARLSNQGPEPLPRVVIKPLKVAKASFDRVANSTEAQRDSAVEFDPPVDPVAKSHDAPESHDDPKSHDVPKSHDAKKSHDAQMSHNTPKGESAGPDNFQGFLKSVSTTLAVPDGDSSQLVSEHAPSSPRDDNLETGDVDALIDKSITEAASKSLAALYGRKNGVPTMEVLEKLGEAEKLIALARSHLATGAFKKISHAQVVTNSSEVDKVLTDAEIEDIILSQRSIEWTQDPGRFSKVFTKNDPDRLPIRQRFPDERFQYDNPKSRVQPSYSSCRHTTAWPDLTISDCSHCGKHHDSAQECAVVRYHQGSELFLSDRPVLEQFPCAYCNSNRHTTNMCTVMHAFCPDCKVRGHRQYKGNGKMNKNRNNRRACSITKEMAQFQKKKFERFSHLGRLTGKDSLKWGFTIMKEHECDKDGSDLDAEV